MQAHSEYAVNKAQTALQEIAGLTSEVVVAKIHNTDIDHACQGWQSSRQLRVTSLSAAMHVRLQHYCVGVHTMFLDTLRLTRVAKLASSSAGALMVPTGVLLSLATICGAQKVVLWW